MFILKVSTTRNSLAFPVKKCKSDNAMATLFYGALQSAQNI
ncbi:hypothetical protein P0136_11650 [Lentisphaerota bacterium ZTH]|nr:hypothetical protein P0136_11650 [Lentisphaerota bacterium ZTH]